MISLSFVLNALELSIYSGFIVDRLFLKSVLKEEYYKHIEELKLVKELCLRHTP